MRSKVLMQMLDDLIKHDEDSEKLKFTIDRLDTYKVPKKYSNIWNISRKVLSMIRSNSSLEEDSDDEDAHEKIGFTKKIILGHMNDSLDENDLFRISSLKLKEWNDFKEVMIGQYASEVKKELDNQQTHNYIEIPEKLIEVKDNKIRIVNFFKDSKSNVRLTGAKYGSRWRTRLNGNKYSSLIGMKPWGSNSSPISNYAVITGKNGAGKSQLLSYIQTLLSADVNKNIFYMPANFQYSDNNSSYYEIPLFDDNRADKYVKFLKIIIPFRASKNVFSWHNMFNLEEEYDQYEIIDQQKDRFVESLISYVESVLRAHKKDINIVEEVYLKQLVEDHIENLMNKLKIEDPEIFWSIVFHAYQKKNLPESNSPWKKVSDILQTYNFNHKIEVYNEIDERTKLYKWKMVRIDNNIEVDFDDLSSGEKVIFSIIAWQFSFSNNIKVDNKVQIMLLDEPDKHLDPKSCEMLHKVIREQLVQKYGIQVIMTTHRIDTVSLAKSNELYLLKKGKEGTLTIEPCHKLQAMFNLTYNLRQMSNIHVKIYVEASNDIKFYEFVHRILMNSSNNIRNANKCPKSKFDWSVLNNSSDTQISNNRILSRRYQPDFHSTSLNNDAGGGSAGVKLSIKTEIENLRKLKNRVEREDFSHRYHKKTSLVDHQFLRPFGITDKDFKKTESDNDRIIKLKRHSIENFIYDPVILFSLLDNHDIENCIIDGEFKKICIKCRDYIEESITNTHNRSINPFADYFSFLLKGYMNFVWYRGEEFTKACQIFNQNSQSTKKSKFEPSSIKDILSQWLLGRIEHDDEVILDKIFQDSEDIKVVVNDKHQFNVRYPRFFLTNRGHSFEDYFDHELARHPIDKDDKFRNYIGQRIDDISLEKDICLPMDVIETLLELNSKIRNQFKEGMKRSALESTILNTQPLLSSSNSNQTQLNSVKQLNLIINTLEDELKSSEKFINTEVGL